MLNAATNSCSIGSSKLAALIAPDKMALTCVVERDDESRYGDTSFKMISTTNKGSPTKFLTAEVLPEGDEDRGVIIFGDSHEKLL